MTISSCVEGVVSRAHNVAVIGWSLHVPGRDLQRVAPGLDGVPACEPEAAHELLGRKGLLGKDSATRLALCAVHRALGRAPGASRPSGSLDPATAVVVSSNLGNIATVTEVVRAVHAGSGRDVSPLAAPNASSNVVAGTVAIWFRFGGPNMTVCSGTPSGLDAVAVAELLLRAGRAERAVVVGVEPGDSDARRLNATRGRGLTAAAACIVLGCSADGPHLPALGPVCSGPLPSDVASLVVGDPATAPMGTACLDLPGLLGDTYGAAGVVGIVVAAALVSGGAVARPDVAVTAGDDVDGRRWVLMRTAPVENGNRP